MDTHTQHWLSTLCHLVQGVLDAALFQVVSGRADLTPVAIWPENQPWQRELAKPVQGVTATSQCALVPGRDKGDASGEPLDIITCPLLLADSFYGVVVIRMSSRSQARQQTALQCVEASAIWFASLVEQRSAASTSQLITLVELVASCLEHERFQSAATDVATDLAARLSCDRVSIGFLRGHTVVVEAVSQSAGFDRKANLVRDIGEAMYEAIDQNSTLVFPQAADNLLVTRCHAVLAGEHGAGALVTIPFAVNGTISGAVLIERPASQPFDRATTEYFQQVVSLIGPVLEVRRRDEQWLPQRMRGLFKQALARYFGPGHAVRKAGLAVALFCVLFSLFASGQYRITSEARLEAIIQRAVVAPQDGYIAETSVRPGDIIHKGDVLGALDDKDLKLEQRKWSSQLEQLRTEYRDALAQHDRSKVGITSARMLQVEAQLNLVDEQLARIQLTAPFDGLIVSGDLSQALGSPVKRGQVLLTAAPLDAYRIILKVDERDITQVKEGQHGILVIAGMPKNPVSFAVEKITPVSTSEEGRNFFQVEARMEKNSDLFRPGMEGIAKINIDRRKLIWIWSHKLVDWIRLTLWSFNL